MDTQVCYACGGIGEIVRYDHEDRVQNEPCGSCYGLGQTNPTGYTLTHFDTSRRKEALQKAIQAIERN